MVERHSLPSRRSCETLSIRHNGACYDVTVGTYADGIPAEVFIDGPKIGSEVSYLVHDIAVLISIAVQYQVPAPVMASAVARIGAAGAPHTIAGAVLDILAGEGAR